MPKPPWRDHFSLSSGKLCQARAFFRVEGVSYALVHMYVAFRPQDNVPSLPLIARRTLQTAFVQHQGLQPAYAVVDRRQIMQPAFVVGDIARTTTAGVWQVARRQEWQNFDYRDHQCATAWKTTLRWARAVDAQASSFRYGRDTCFPIGRLFNKNVGI
jgi:hypothetical protein